MTDAEALAAAQALLDYVKSKTAAYDTGSGDMVIRSYRQWRA